MKRGIDVPNSLKLTIAGSLMAAAIHAGAESEIPRTPSGRPDLSGTYDIATLTPLQRPEEFGENLYMTPEQADEIVQSQLQDVADKAKPSDADRAAPPPGGDGSPGAAGSIANA